MSLDKKSVAEVVSKKVGFTSELASCKESSDCGKRLVRLTDCTWNPSDGQKMPKTMLVKLVDPADEQLKIVSLRLCFI